MPALRTFDWRMESVRREVAVIAYHFHWSRAECMTLSRQERIAWIKEINRINKDLGRAAKGK